MYLGAIRKTPPLVVGKITDTMVVWRTQTLVVGRTQTMLVGRTDTMVARRRTQTIFGGRTPTVFWENTDSGCWKKQVLVIGRKAAERERESEKALRKPNNVELHILHYLLECDVV